MKNTIAFLIVISFLLLSCSVEKQDDIQVYISEYNATALQITYQAPFQDNNLIIGNAFANTKPYMILLSSTDTAFTYLVSFPIYWNSAKPYAVFNTGNGIIESEFLLYHHLNENPPITVFFAENLTVFNSQFGQQQQFSATEKDMLKTFFVFGKQQREEFNIDNSSYSIISTNTTKTEQIKTLITYYHRTFGSPKITNYTVVVGDANSFSSRTSGFFGTDRELRYYAHELFHLWEPDNMSCNNNIAYREGLASYMQWFAQLETGIISKEQYQHNIYLSRELLRSMNATYQHMSYDELVAIRSKQPIEYKIMVYDKGFILWDMINKTDNIPRLFNNLLRTQNCSRIISALDSAEKQLGDTEWNYG